MGNLDERNPLPGGESNANSSPSGGQGQSLPEFEAVLRRLEAAEGEIKALKSGKDKRIPKIEGDLSQTQTTVARIAQLLNVDESKVLEAQRADVLDQIVEERLSGRQPGSAIPGRVDEQGISAEAQTIYQRAGLNPNSPEAAAIEAQGLSPVDKAIAAAKVAADKAKVPQPGPGDSAPPQGSAVPAPPDPKDPKVLAANYQKDLAAIIQNPAIRMGDERVKAIAALKDKYRAQGYVVT